VARLSLHQWTVRSGEQLHFSSEMSRLRLSKVPQLPGLSPLYMSTPNWDFLAPVTLRSNQIRVLNMVPSMGDVVIR
jgi:hypothetical protein